MKKFLVAFLFIGMIFGFTQAQANSFSLANEKFDSSDQSLIPTALLLSCEPSDINPFDIKVIYIYIPHGSITAQVDIFLKNSTTRMPVKLEMNYEGRAAWYELDSPTGLRNRPLYISLKSDDLVWHKTWHATISENQAATYTSPNFGCKWIRDGGLPRFTR